MQFHLSGFFKEIVYFFIFQLSKWILTSHFRMVTVQQHAGQTALPVLHPEEQKQNSQDRLHTRCSGCEIHFSLNVGLTPSVMSLGIKPVCWPLNAFWNTSDTKTCLHYLGGLQVQWNQTLKWKCRQHWQSLMRAILQQGLFCTFCPESTALENYHCNCTLIASTRYPWKTTVKIVMHYEAKQWLTLINWGRTDMNEGLWAADKKANTCISEAGFPTSTALLSALNSPSAPHA